jgi:hypothetical protein
MWHRRWLRYGLFAIVGLALAFAIAVYLGDLELKRAIAEADRLDPGWRFADIQANRATAADAENSALICLSLRSIFRQTQFNPAANINSVTRVIGDIPNVQLNDDDKAVLAKAITAGRPAIKECLKLENMPRGRFPIHYQEDYYSTMMDTQEAHRAVSVLTLNFLNRLGANDIPGVAASLRASGNAVRSIGDEPFLVTMHQRMSWWREIIPQIEFAMAQMNFSDKDLASFYSQLASEEPEKLFLHSIRGERAGSFDGMDYLARHPLAAMTTIQFYQNNWWNQYFGAIPQNMRSDQAKALRYANQVVECARRPPHEWASSIAQCEPKPSSLSIPGLTANGIIDKMIESALKGIAAERCTMTAIAAERFRLRSDQWPESLEELVNAELLAAVPLDPFDGQPVRWKKSAEGRIIYSVGVNLVDDGGDNTLFNAHPKDIVFRLYDPDKRQLPARPTKSKDGESSPKP